MKNMLGKWFFASLLGLAVASGGSPAWSPAQDLRGLLFGWLQEQAEGELRGWILNEILLQAGIPETGNVRVDEANREFVQGVIDRNWTLFEENFLAPNDTAADGEITGLMDRLEMMMEHWQSLGEYSEVVTEEMGAMMSGAGKDLRKLQGKRMASDLEWVLESRRMMAAFIARQRLQALQSQGGGKAEALVSAERRLLQPAAGIVVTRDLRADAATASAGPSPAERWKRLNAAMDAYEQEKNTAADRSAEVFQSAYEKQAYDNILRTLGGEREQRALQLEEQNFQAAQLQGELRDLNERIPRKTAAIDELKAQVGRLKSRAAQSGAAAAQAQTQPRTQTQVQTQGQTQAQDRQLQQEIARVNTSIAAEEASLRAMQTQRSQASSTLNTLVSGLALVDTVSRSSASERAKAYSQASDYAEKPAPGGSASQGIDPNWSAYVQGLNARNQAYVQSRMQDRISGGDSHWKIMGYRQKIGK